MPVPVHQFLSVCSISSCFAQCCSLIVFSCAFLSLRKFVYEPQTQFGHQGDIQAVNYARQFVLFAVPASVIGQYSSNDVRAREGDTVVLSCNVTGVPQPEVTWYRRHRLATHVTTRRRRAYTTDAYYY